MNMREEIEHDWISSIRPEFGETYMAIKEWLTEKNLDWFFMYTILYDLGYARGKRAERQRRHNR